MSMPLHKLRLVVAVAILLLETSARAAPAPCAGIKRFALGDSCVTCAGISVKRVRRGLVHGVEVNGRFWTDASADAYSNARAGGKAEEVCRAKDPALRLPTKDEIIALTGMLHHDGNRACEAYAELNAVMPDSVGRHMWTSTPDAKDPKRAWMYWGTTNDLTVAGRGALGAVRCLGEPPDVSAPPTDHAAAAPPLPDSSRRGPFEGCVTSLTQDSHAGVEAAFEACKTQYSQNFYLCVYQLTNAGSELKAAIDACLRNSSREFVTCAVKNSAAPGQCLKTPAPSAAEADAGKLDRYQKSCAAGNLLGCVLVGKERAKSGDKAGAARDFKKACGAGYQPGCDALTQREK